jgi:Tol biopolymer transport system component
VAFYSYASDLVTGDGNASSDVFVRDLVAGTTVRAGVDITGGDPNNGSYGTSISADGRYVAFQSYASDLVPEDGNSRPECSSGGWPELTSAGPYRDRGDVPAAMRDMAASRVHAQSRDLPGRSAGSGRKPLDPSSTARAAGLKPVQPLPM